MVKEGRGTGACRGNGILLSVVGKVMELLWEGSQFFSEIGDAENESDSGRLEALRSFKMVIVGEK